MGAFNFKGSSSDIDKVLFPIFFVRSPILSKAAAILIAAKSKRKSSATGCLRAIVFITTSSIWFSI